MADADREAGLALGATRWQVARRVVIPGARRGIRASVTLAMGRALGEAIAVAMVIGNNTALPHSLLAPGATLGSAIVNNFSEANPGTLEKSGVVAWWWCCSPSRCWSTSEGNSCCGPASRRCRHGARSSRQRRPSRDWARPVTGPALTIDATVPSTAASPRDLVRAGTAQSLARRRRLGRVATSLCVVALCISLVPLVALVAYIDLQGPAGAVGWIPGPHAHPRGDPRQRHRQRHRRARSSSSAWPWPWPSRSAWPPPCSSWSGRGGSSATLRFGADVLTGAPSIAIGVFAYAVFVVDLRLLGAGRELRPGRAHAAHHAARQRGGHVHRARRPVGGRAGPRGRRGPGSCAPSCCASALPGIVTGNLLAMARAIGETAPLIFTIFGSQFFVLRPTAPMAAMPLTIYTNATQAYPDAQRTAWGTALVLDGAGDRPVDRGPGGLPAYLNRKTQ